MKARLQVEVAGLRAISTALIKLARAVKVPNEDKNNILVAQRVVARRRLLLDAACELSDLADEKLKEGAR